MSFQFIFTKYVNKFSLLANKIAFLKFVIDIIYLFILINI